METFAERYTDQSLHYYFYFIDKELGLCYLRVPTWAPFRLQFYFNGHNWLARKLEENGFAFNLVDNAFIDISDFEQAQDIADSFNVRRLHRILDRYASMCCPVVKQFRAGVEWTIMQLEYATDIVFRNRDSLQRLYEPLIRTAVNAIKADDVARFLGRKQVHGNFNGELGTNFGTRIEGTRLKHHMARSSLFHGIDLDLLVSLVRGEQAITGLRNRDIQRHLGWSGSQVSPLLKRLRLHGLLKKVPRRHKYYLTALGRRLIACCLPMREEMVLPALALPA